MAPKDSNGLPIYGMDQEIKGKIDGKLSPEQLKEATEWVQKILGRQVDLTYESLKDGVILCEIFNKIYPEKAVKINAKTTMAFKLMENISAYLSGCEAIGCPKSDLFQTVDLFENKNFPQVILSLFSLARYSVKNGKNIPLLGPKLNEKHTVEFTEQQLKAGQFIPSKQASGSFGGATASGYHPGAPRQIINPAIAGHARPENLPPQPQK